MFCPDCGSPIPEGGVCPNCQKPAPEPEQPETVQAEKIEKKTRKIKIGKFSEISVGSKNYAALLSAALVFPAAICTALDLSFHRYDFWFGYVVGALAVVWICFVLPALKVFHPAVNALISFAAIMGYISFVMYKTGHLEWIYQQALPLFVLFAVFVAIDVMLISYKKVDVLTVLSVLSGEIGVYLLAIEATHQKGFTNLHWSPILAAGFISVAAVLIAFAYVGKNNRNNTHKH
jgi:hypothetical protein